MTAAIFECHSFPAHPKSWPKTGSRLILQYLAQYIAYATLSNMLYNSARKRPRLDMRCTCARVT